jgi:hypothetical protein
MEHKWYQIIFIAAILVIIATGIVAAYQMQSQPMRSSSGSRSVPAAMESTVKITVSATSAISPVITTTSPVISTTIPAGTISPERAQTIARKLFPNLDPDRVNITFTPGTTHNQASYDFDMFKNDERIAQGGLDPGTGKLMWYAIPVKRSGRPEQQPVITLGNAQTIAEREIQTREGPISLNLNSSRYDLLGSKTSIGSVGVYIFTYNRSAKSNPCDSDGFTLEIDSVYGTVVGYWETWITPPYPPYQTC